MQVGADQALGRVEAGKRELFGEVVGERALRRREGFEIVVPAIATAAPDRRPLGRRRKLARGRPRRRLGAVGRKHVLQIGVEPLLDRGAAGFQVLAQPIA